MKENSIRFSYMKRASKLLLYIERWLAKTGKFRGRLKLSRDYMINVEFEGTWAAHLKDCTIELHNTSRNPSETNPYP